MHFSASLLHCMHRHVCRLMPFAPPSLAPLVACSSCESDVLALAENGVTTHTGCGDLTSDETEDLLKLLEAVADVSVGGRRTRNSSG